VASNPKNLNARIARLICIANESRERATLHGDAIELPTEAERQRARCTLLRLYRWQWKRVGRKELAAVHPLVWQTVNDWGLRIFAAPNPIQALEYFLGKRQHPGKRTSPKTIDRHLYIAVCVVKTMRKRVAKKEWRQCMTMEKAAEKVAAEHNLQTEYVIEIYYRYKIEAQALVADEALVGVELGTETERQASFAPNISNWVEVDGMWGPPRKLP
jgi:hypothetical protein